MWNKKTCTDLGYELAVKNADDKCLKFLRYQNGFLLSSHINRSLSLSWSPSKWLSSPDTPQEVSYLLEKRSCQVQQDGSVSNNLPLPLWLSFQSLDREFPGKRPEIVQLGSQGKSSWARPQPWSLIQYYLSLSSSTDIIVLPFKKLPAVAPTWGLPCFSVQGPYSLAGSSTPFNNFWSLGPQDEKLDCILLYQDKVSLIVSSINAPQRVLNCFGKIKGLYFKNGFKSPLCHLLLVTATGFGGNYLNLFL